VLQKQEAQLFRGEKKKGPDLGKKVKFLLTVSVYDTREKNC